jgi:hypothetical protein
MMMIVIYGIKIVSSFFLYNCEMWSIILMAEHELKLSEGRKNLEK